MEDIYLRDATDDKGTIEVLNMMNNIDGIKQIFGGRIDRVYTSAYSLLILKDEIIIGFINLVVEKVNPNFLFIDMGIKPEYRNQGIGTYVLKTIKKMLENMDDKTFVIGQTKANNKGGNGSIKDVGCFLGEYEDNNLYLLQDERLDEFLNNNYYEKLVKHLEEQNKKKSLLFK